MILESIVTTLNPDGSPNISPMGPTVPDNLYDGLDAFELRPFETSQTFANLKRTGEGVLHITDDVDLFARAAIGKLSVLPKLEPASTVAGNVIVDACRWHEFKVEFMDQTGPRINMNCRTVYSQRQRDFWGFNRAMHAVLEAAILATRLDFLPAEISQQFIQLQTTVSKTGGRREKEAFDLLRQFVEDHNGTVANA